MCPEHKNEETIFYVALDIKSPSERTAYLEEACGNDKKLLARIEALLNVQTAEHSILEAVGPHLRISFDEEPLSECPGTVIGRYKLLEKIGEGGMAVVYMAEQTEPIHRKVALKIIKLGMDTKAVISRFEAERQALAMMDHPNIARVLDAGATETGRPYFVMELVTGVSITEYCDKNNLSTKDRLALFIQVCNTVQHAHKKGIIHRDIKPTNVMVTRHEGQVVPKVIDFGIAKATKQRITEKTIFTRYSHMIGTPAYMSPEQAEYSDSEIDNRTDIYSLGILLYEMLTGTTPFAKEQLHKAGYLEMQRVICKELPVKPSTKLSTLGEVLKDVAEHQGTKPDTLKKLIRGDLDWIVMKALEKDRTRRYETANDLMMDIKRHLTHVPVMAGPPSTMYRLHKFVQRHRAAVITMALVTGATLMGATAVKLSVWMSNGSAGIAQHAAGMVQRHVWDAPPESSFCGGISPDGRYLSYTDWTAGNLAVRDMTTETSWPVTKNTDSTWKTIDGWADNSVVSPDGTQIAYSWCNEKGLNYYDLRLTDLDGSNIRVLYSDPSIFYIIPYAWSPDGREILACLGDKDKSPVDEQTGELYQKKHFVLVSVADGSVCTLKTWHKYAYPRRAFFSPDGNHIVFDFEQQAGQGRYDIHLINRDGGGEIPLIQHSADDRLFGWVPDGRTVIFTSDRTAGRGLWTIEVLNGVPQGPAELLIDEFNGSGLCFTADGSCYYVVNTTASNVCLARLDSTCTAFEDEPRLASSQFVGHTVLGDISPDGRFLVYRTGGRDKVDRGNWIFVLNDLDVNRERVLRPTMAFRPDSKMWDGPWFYPDGNSLLVLGSGLEAGYGLYKIDIETGFVEPIQAPCEEGKKGIKSAALSPDGNTIYTRTMYRIIKLDISTGRKTVLYENPQWGPWEFDVSPDGQMLAFYLSQDSLAIISAEGGEPREIVHGSEGELWSNRAFVKWTPDGEELLFGKRKNELWKVNVETGRQQQIAVIGQDLINAVMHPDGRRIVITAQQAGSQLWVMENFLPQWQSE